MTIPIIDLFAGPGGLGEGFSSLRDANGEAAFKIRLSIEKDPHAHRTLELRAFFRQFPHKKVPQAYYEYLANPIDREHLFNLFPRERDTAKREAWLAELGVVSYDTTKEMIEQALGQNTANWIVIGGPPCQAYSLVGRAKMIGEHGREKFEQDHRHFLYRQYLQILADHQPPVFVMENVKGLLSATFQKERIFARILSDLRNPPSAVPTAAKPVSYNLWSLVNTSTDLLGAFEAEDYVVRSEEYGIPQARHRVIILGIRSDWNGKPRTLQSQKLVPIEEAIGDLPRLRSALSKEVDSPTAWRDAIRELTDAGWFSNGQLNPELRGPLTSAAAKLKTNLKRGSVFLQGLTRPSHRPDWFVDPKLRGVCNHETRSHIRADLHRYFFAAVFARKYTRSPLLQDLPRALLPDHKNVEEALENTKFNDRFRVQYEGRPATTVTSHIAKDGHYFIHYDPTQCRSLTVREAARLQTFPDNYFFEGPRTEQYHQVGNAVPPLLARQIAEIVRDLFR